MYIIRNILIFGLLITLFNVSFSAAETNLKTPSIDGTEGAGPYYNPASKSYFELFRMQILPGMHANWQGAKELAAKKYFKNTEGRLAIIRNLATHQFILQNFSARNYWIGLQYFCRSRTLKWVDGSNAAKSKFSVWDSQWSNTTIRCGNMSYMPIHYTTATTTKALRWRASGPHKNYIMYLVEYPTGKK